MRGSRPLVNDPTSGSCTFDLTDEETAALLRELDGLIDGGRYFLSPRIKTLKAIRAKMRPGAGAGAFAAAAEAICATAGDPEAEMAYGPLKQDAFGWSRSVTSEPSGLSSPSA